MKEKKWGGIPHGIVAKVLEYEIIVRKFKLQFHYYVHFWTNALRKGMNSITSPAVY